MHSLILRAYYTGQKAYHLMTLQFHATPDDFDGRHVDALRELGYHFGMHTDPQGLSYFTIERDNGEIVLEPASHVQADGWDKQLTDLIRRGYDELIPHEVPGATHEHPTWLDGYSVLGHYPFDNEGRD